VLWKPKQKLSQSNTLRLFCEKTTNERDLINCLKTQNLLIPYSKLQQMMDLLHILRLGTPGTNLAVSRLGAVSERSMSIAWQHSASLIIIGSESDLTEIIWMRTLCYIQWNSSSRKRK